MTTEEIGDLLLNNGFSEDAFEGKKDITVGLRIILINRRRNEW